MSAGESNSTSLPEVQPQHIAEFRKINGPTGEYAIPEIPDNREMTDFIYTKVFCACMLFLLPFLKYTFAYSDLNRYTHGFDMCGNICGRYNTHVDGIVCSGRDTTDLPFLKFIEVLSTSSNGRKHKYELKPGNYYECVTSCDLSEYTIILNTCYPTSQDVFRENLYKSTAVNIKKYPNYVVALCLTALGLSAGMLRYFVSLAWTMLSGLVAGIVIITVFLLCMSLRGKKSTEITELLVVFIVLSVTFVYLLKSRTERIKVVIRLFEEATKVMFGVPSIILLVPLLTLLARSTLLFVLFFSWLTFSTSGRLQSVTDIRYMYVPDAVMVFTMVFHTLVCFWVYKFITGCQHMVISGAVSACYFSKDKTTLTWPVYNSLYNLIRYHWGSVAFGSFRLSVFRIIKPIIPNTCFSPTSKNAYIVAAMHGRPLVESGQRAARLLAVNDISAVAATCILNSILFTAQFWIVFCSIIIANLIGDHSREYGGVTLVVIFTSAIIANCFLKVFGVVIDTIFLCACEDLSMNESMERPYYYMTIKLMQYMEDFKKTMTKTPSTMNITHV